jgi:muramoyltetrapeptide carboxypeptidase
MTIARSIRLIAPSGYPVDPTTVERGISRLRAAGHRIEGAEVTRRQMQRFAGTDAQRLADLNQLADPAVALPDIVLAVRGGYGATRLLADLDYAGLRKRLSGSATALVGHSDFTAIQLALLAQAGLTTFGGPMLCANFGADTLDDYTWDNFWRTLSEPVTTLRFDTPQLDTVALKGTLWGGNLALLAALAGTPYMPRIEGGILFVEDVNEPPFRIERMLYQLHYAGILARQQAVVLGDFTQYRLAEHDNGYTLDTMIANLRMRFGMPFLTGLQFGHVARILTLPVGAPAELDSDSGGFSLRFSGYPHYG